MRVQPGLVGHQVDERFSSDDNRHRRRVPLNGRTRLRRRARAGIDHLRTAAAEGRLTFEELADRIEEAGRAVTRGDLVPLTADLPTGLRAAEPIRVSVMGDIKRSGAWVVPPECRFRSAMGSIKLDLREATITASEVVIDAFTPFGTIDLVVPEGVEVDARSTGKLKQQAGPATPGAPRIVLKGGTVFGTVKVRHKRRWLKRR
jgi:hypothetical protein